MPVRFPTLTIPPRPPELPAVPPPATSASPIELKGPHLRNDAFLSRWVEEFERVVKDAWANLANLITTVEERIVALETRISDTYTWGQRGGLQHEQFVALPLRVVRQETLVEFAIAVETPSTSGAVIIDLRRNGVFLTQATLPVGGRFVAVPVTLALAKNDALAVVVAQEGTDTEDLVVQARCR